MLVPLHMETTLAQRVIDYSMISFRVECKHFCLVLTERSCCMHLPSGEDTSQNSRVIIIVVAGGFGIVILLLISVITITMIFFLKLKFSIKCKFMYAGQSC